MTIGLQRLLQTLSDRHGYQNSSISIPKTSPGYAGPSDRSLTSTPGNDKMGIKESGDYITARGANPRTGLVSPSVMTAPSTPTSPGDALRMNGHQDAQGTPTKSQPRAKQYKHQQHRKVSASRWKQNNQGWFEETMDMTSFKPTSANSSAVRAGASIDDDLFLPTPLDEKHQPWKDTAQSAARAAAMKHCQVTMYPNPRVSEVGIPPLNERMMSVGAGPRRFVEASKKLRICTLKGGQQVSTTESTQAVMNTAVLPGGPSASLVGPASSQSPRLGRSTSYDESETFTSTMRDVTDDHSGAKKHRLLIPRKPVGSPSGVKRRNGTRSASATATCIVENAPPYPTRCLDEGTTLHPRANIVLSPNQLLHMRPIDPNPGNTRPSHRRHNQPYAQIRQLPIRSTEERPAPEIKASPQVSGPLLRYPEAATPSTADQQAWALVANMASLPLHHFYDTWIAAADSGMGVRRALHVLTDEDAELHDRWVAGEALLGSVGRWTMVLGLVIAVFRLGVLVCRVLNVLFWPVGIVLAVVRWSPF